MAALSWQISSDGKLDLTPNKNYFEVIKIKYKGGKKVGFGFLFLFQVLEGTLESCLQPLHCLAHTSFHHFPSRKKRNQPLSGFNF